MAIALHPAFDQSLLKKLGAVCPGDDPGGKFLTLVDELPTGFPFFDHELAYEVWLSDVAFSIEKQEDGS